VKKTVVALVFVVQLEHVEEAMTGRADRVRVQVDLSQVEVSLLDVLRNRLAVRSRSDLLQQAIGTFLWIVGEMLSGRRIISVTRESLEDLPQYKELSLPALAPSLFNQYEYLIQRPEMGRSQPYLKGRNMTVGQLVVKMRANELTIEEAAADMDLPVAQVREAAAYYEAHRDQVDGEMAEEVDQLRHGGSDA
jgi:uncharacterized protein (DUF433 family)